MSPNARGVVAIAVLVAFLVVLKALFPAREPAAPIAAELKRQEDADSAYALARIAIGSLRKAVRDPNSLVVEEVYSRRPANAICIRYRAKNGFGGFNRATIVFAGLLLSEKVATWNKYCSGEGFYDISTWALGG